MSFHWNYPLYVLPHEQGYASLVDGQGGDEIQSLIACTTLQAAVELMNQFAMLGAPKPLRNHREFRWLLQSLQAPVSHVVFDPAPTDDQVNAQWGAAVDALLASHLPSDNSPWNYPVFVIGQAEGFASIEAPLDDHSTITAIGIFTTSENAESYLEAANEAGELLELTDLETAVTFLSAIQDDVSAVAIDPRIDAGRHTAEYCLGIDVLLDKYLVREELHDE